MNIATRIGRVVAPALLVAGLAAGCQSTRGSGLELESLMVAKQAFMDSWTKHEGDTFSLDKLSHVVETSDAFLSFDAMSQQKTVVRGYDAYAAIWGPGMGQFKTARLSETENVHVWIGDGMAVTASLVRVEGEMLDGTKLDMPAHLTLAWLRGDRGWRAIHEHMSLGVKP